MADEQKNHKPRELSAFSGRGAGAGLSASELIALVLSVVWFFGAISFFVFVDGGESGTDGLRALLVVIAVVMPVAMIWLGAGAARASRILREESARMHAAVDTMRKSYLIQQQAGAGGERSSVEKKLEEIAAAQRKTEHAIAMFTSIRPAAEAQIAAEKAALPAQGSAEDQGLLALGTPAEALNPPLSVADFVRALHFPESVDDKEGFRALRRALQDRKASQLVQAAQDVLTLLSQDGIYMDDLRPDRARPEVWRKFAQGERGRAVAALGGVRDRSSLALAAGRMRQDAIFRDAVHHFLRKFDHTFSEFEKSASDAEIADLGDTRTARAFMLLGRVTGTFD